VATVICPDFNYLHVNWYKVLFPIGAPPPVCKTPNVAFALVIITPASYLGGHGFVPMPADRLPCLRFLMIFLSPTVTAN
jgi:hypothetical protein